MPRRLAAVTAAVLSLLACTPTTTQAVPMTDQPQPSATSREARRAIPAMSPLTPTAVPTGIAMTTAPTYLVGSQHAAFPGLAARPDSQLELVYRQGSDHYVARDGQSLVTLLDGMGRNPAPPVTELSGGTDYRDPSVSYIDTVRYLTYFVGSNNNPAEGAYVTVNGGTPVRVDPGYPYAAICAPVVQLPDGRLGAAYYGRKPGETKDTAFMAWSSDSGQTWTSNRILAPGGTTATPEPWIAVHGDKVLFFARWGPDRLAVRVSTDSGTTWGAPYLLSETVAMTGRPTAYVTSAGVVIVVYRTLPARHAQVAYSLDGGTIWKTGPIVMAAPAGSPLGMTYAAMHEVMPGVVRTIVGMEKADGSSALYSTTLGVSVQ